MSYSERQTLRNILLGLQPYLKKNIHEVKLAYENGEISLLSFNQQVTRFCVMRDVLEYWMHYPMDMALQLIAPIMIDLSKINNEIELQRKSDFQHKLSKLESIYKTNGFTSKHSIFKIPVRVH